MPNDSALRSESGHSAPIAHVPAVASEKPRLRISIRLYNYAHAPGGALADAKTEARRILAAAGVDSLWLDCSLAGPPFESGANQDCGGPSGGRPLLVRILPGVARIEKRIFLNRRRS
jgi:hypothetical protein